MPQINDDQTKTNAPVTQTGEPLDYRQRHLQASIETLEHAINTISQVDDCLSEMAELILDARMDTSRTTQQKAIQETYREERQKIGKILKTTPSPVRKLLQTQAEEERLSFDPAGSLKIRLPAINLTPDKTGLDVPDARLAFRTPKALAQTSAHLDHAQRLITQMQRHFAETLGALNEQLGQVERVGAPVWSARRPSHPLKADAAQHTQCEQNHP